MCFFSLLFQFVLRICPHIRPAIKYLHSGLNMRSFARITSEASLCPSNISPNTHREQNPQPLSITPSKPELDTTYYANKEAETTYVTETRMVMITRRERRTRVDEKTESLWGFRRARYSTRPSCPLPVSQPPRWLPCRSGEMQPLKTEHTISQNVHKDDVENGKRKRWNTK